MQVYFDDIAACLEYVRTGGLRALGVTSAFRVDALPNVPALAEFVAGYEATGWYGIGAPKDTPAEIAERLNHETNVGLADPQLRARLADLGYVTFAGTPAEFATLIAQEVDKWAKVTKFAGLKPD